MYSIICYSKESDWEQPVRTKLDKAQAEEMCSELNASASMNGSRDGYYVTKTN